MLLLVMLLTIASMAIEIMLVMHVPVIGTILRKFRVASLVFSFVLSWFAGAAFGAAGLLVFAAGILSTICMQPVYWAMEHGYVEQIGERIEAIKAWCVTNKNEIGRRWNQLVALVKFLLKVLAIPFVVLGIIADAIERMHKGMDDLQICWNEFCARFSRV